MMTKKQLMIDTLIDKYYQVVLDITLDLKDSVNKEEYEECIKYRNDIQDLSERFAMSIHTQFDIEYDHALIELENINQNIYDEVFKK